jgi:phosphomannomutase
MPRYTILKSVINFPADRIPKLIGWLKVKEKDARLDEQDGIKFIWPDRWVHIRPSGTEPVLRLILEAPTPEAAASLQNAFRQEIEATAA